MVLCVLVLRHHLSILECVLPLLEVVATQAVEPKVETLKVEKLEETVLCCALVLIALVVLPQEVVELLLPLAVAAAAHEVNQLQDHGNVVYYGTFLEPLATLGCEEVVEAACQD